MNRVLKTMPKACWVLGAVLVVAFGLGLSRQQRPKPLPMSQASQAAQDGRST